MAQKKAKASIQIGDDTLNLRIYTRNVAALNDKLGMDLQAAVMQIFDDPSLLAPILWACMAGKDKADQVSMDDAYDAVDALIDQGYTSDKLMELAIDVGENSGFFTGSRTVMMRTLPAKMIEASKAMDSKISDNIDKNIQRMTEIES